MKTVTNSTIMTKAAAKHTLLLLISLALIHGMIACKGPAGAEGTQGPQGPQGPEGPVGPAGEDGSVIHAGTGAPSGDTGKTGDFYLDTNTGQLYGPKDETDGWNVPINLRGADGQEGTDGSQIYSGTSAPDASLGVPGDYYLNKDTFDLYGPKADGGWGTPVNLQATTNVMYTSWFEPVWALNDEARYKRLRVTEFRLTPEFLNGGVVLVYRRYMSGPAHREDTLLPQTIYFVDGNVFRTYRSYISGNGIYIEIRAFNRDLDPAHYDATHNLFRYVLIPGSVDISSATSVRELPVDLEDYKQVKKYFGISD